MISIEQDATSSKRPSFIHVAEVVGDVRHTAAYNRDCIDERREIFMRDGCIVELQGLFQLGLRKRSTGKLNPCKDTDCYILFLFSAFATVYAA
jgi:hypothetical protein